MASLRENLIHILEDRFKVRILPMPDNTNIGINTKKDGDLGSLIQGDLQDGYTIDLARLNEFRTMSNDREFQYKIYDDMKEDSTIAAALEMYADDATQADTRGKILWVESDDPDVAAFGNRLIDVLGLEGKAWSHIYSLCLYGDLYLQTYDNIRQDDRRSSTILEPLNQVGNMYIQKKVNGSILEEYVEEVDNPANIYDLERRGKTIGFIEIPRIENDTEGLNGLSYNLNNYNMEYSNDVDIMKPDRYIHICLSPDVNRNPETLTLTSRSADGKEVDEIKTKLKVKRGKSILHDVYKIYQELKIMEDSLLLNRVTRSSIIRLLQVEVGDMPKSQVTQLMKRLKDKIEQKNLLDKDQGSFKNQAAPGPIDQIIYTPTRDGKGQISMSNIGGDVDVKSITDIDYFKNKLYGGLKIPKQFLGEDMEGSGLSSGTSLTKLDARYARTIKRIQNAYITGITTLINIFAIDKGLEESHVNNFVVKMASPATTEDAERTETFNTNIDSIKSFLELISQDDMTDAATRKKVMMHFITNMMNEPEVTEMLEEDETAEKAVEGNGEEGDVSEPDFGDTGDFGGDDFGDDFGGEDFGEDEGFDEEPQDFGNESEPPTTDFDNVESDEEGFGDFSDEY